MTIALNTLVPLNALQALFSSLSQVGQARLVGGCVREVLRGIAPHDIDIATTALPQDVMDALSRAGYRCIPIGIQYGTVMAMHAGQQFEITTLRSDIKTYGRHADVKFTTNWEEDASRRDFTINAMYMDLDGAVYDYFNGKSDLEKLCIRFIGDAEARIKEDYLRILRYFRFYSYLGGSNIDDRSLQACATLASGIHNLSGERVRTELLKLLKHSHVSLALRLMQRTEVLSILLPRSEKIDISAMHMCEDGLLNLAALLKASHIMEDELAHLCRRLALSNEQKQLLHILLFEIKLGAHSTTTEHLAALYYNGRGIYAQYIALFKILHPDVDILDIGAREVGKFPIKGYHLMKLGLAGKEIGDTIGLLEEMWLQSGCKLSEEEMITKVKERLNTRDIRENTKWIASCD